MLYVTQKQRSVQCCEVKNAHEPLEFLKARNAELQRELESLRRGQVDGPAVTAACTRGWLLFFVSQVTV